MPKVTKASGYKTGISTYLDQRVNKDLEKVLSNAGISKSELIADLIKHGLRTHPRWSKILAEASDERHPNNSQRRKASSRRSTFFDI